MHFYSITVVIICKIFEVVKSNIIILMADCYNYLHTFSKIFFCLDLIIFGENKGGGRHQVLKKSKIWGQQKFVADGLAEGQKIGRVTISAIL